MLLMDLPDARQRQLLSSMFVLIGVIDFLMAVIGIYMIMYHSPTHFKNYKWIQLHIAVSVFYADFFGALSSTFLINLTGYSGAIVLSKFNYGLWLSSLFGCLTLDGLLHGSAAISLAFYYRTYTLVPPKYKLQLSKVHDYAFPVLFLSIRSVPLFGWCSIPNAEKLKNIIAADVNLWPLRNLTETVVLIPDSGSCVLWAKGCCAFFVALFIPCVLALIGVVYKFLIVNKAISERTRKMQWRMLYSLFVQGLVPLLVTLVPYYIYILNILEFPLIFLLRPCAPYAGIVGCTHTIFNTFIMIVLTKPYREQMKLMLGMKTQNRPRTFSVTTRMVVPAMSTKEFLKEAHCVISP